MKSVNTLDETVVNNLLNIVLEYLMSNAHDKQTAIDALSIVNATRSKTGEITITSDCVAGIDTGNLPEETRKQLLSCNTGGNE